MWLTGDALPDYDKQRGSKQKETTKLNLPESFATVSLCVFVLVPSETSLSLVLCHTAVCECRGGVVIVIN